MNIQLLQEHWVNGRKFAPGTVLDLPEPCARNLIEADAAREPDADPTINPQPEPTETE
ncbi:MAG TPA: hypothetical protein PKJ98_09330 [Verrucomicrobiota bacterium]|nr:hypothetical protein [Verrucomicrobiota bacterium]